jgi:hypothetical protein
MIGLNWSDLPQYMIESELLPAERVASGSPQDGIGVNLSQ